MIPDQARGKFFGEAISALPDLEEARGRFRPCLSGLGDEEPERMNPAEAIAATQVVHDLSLFGLFWNAHIIVKLVMLGLLGASVWCWAIIIDKTLLFARTKRGMDRFEEIFWSGQSLEELYRSLGERT